MSDEMTLGAAKAQLQEGLDKGTNCLCCGRYNKVYKRALNSGLAKFLVEVAKRTGSLLLSQRWFHINNDFSEHRLLCGGDYSKLSHWGLFEQHPNTDEEKSASGLWRITDKGLAFVKGEITVPARVHLLNNDPVGFSEDVTDVSKSLGTPFTYAELMAA